MSSTQSPQPTQPSSPPEPPSWAQGLLALFLPARGRDEFVTEDDSDEAREIGEFEVLGA